MKRPEARFCLQFIDRHVFAKLPFLMGTEFSPPPSKDLDENMSVFQLLGSPKYELHRITID